MDELTSREGRLGSAAIPDTLTLPQLDSWLASRLGGGHRAVVWNDRGDEVLLHADATRTRIAGEVLLVALELETDQSGRQSVVVAFALGKRDDAAGLYAVTDELPRGEGALVARWGRIAQDAVWAALLQLATEHAASRGLQPRGFALAGGALHLIAAAARSSG
jgi:hypothetical protein